MIELDRARRWRERAAQVRAQAEHVIMDASAQQALLQLAMEWEQMAERQEARAGRACELAREPEVMHAAGSPRDVRSWRMRAEELRARADETTDASVRSVLLNSARDLERTAEQAEQRPREAD